MACWTPLAVSCEPPKRHHDVDTQDTELKLWSTTPDGKLGVVTVAVDPDSVTTSAGDFASDESPIPLISHVPLRHETAVRVPLAAAVGQVTATLAHVPEVSWRMTG